MNRSHYLCWVFGLLTIFGLASLATAQKPSITPKDIVVLQDPIEVQTRGPLHEAFAQPFDLQSEPGTLIQQEPPAPIPEEPPEQRPDAENAEWIPGYWAWDSQGQEFMWISGVYRVPPQGRNFIPGYWQHTPDGWRWVSGFWSDANQQELPYTPAPPAPLDSGPSMPAPDDNSVYVPGAWAYRDARFVWQPGYYAPVQPGRVWNPPHYVWTPNGYLFVNGYWDYPLEARALVFAPVCFRRPLWTDPSWRYRPSFVVSVGAIFDSAFVRTGGPHFYFGNYYDPLYGRSGFRPWYAGAGRHDPVFAYHGWQNHRGDPNWVGGVQQVYANRTNGRVARPPLTMAQQTAFASAKSAAPVVTPLSQFRSNHLNLIKATPTQLDAHRAFAQRTQQIARNRSQLDAASIGKRDPGPPFRTGDARSLKLPTLMDAKAGPQGMRLANDLKSRPAEATQGAKIVPTPARIPQSTVTPATPRINTPPLAPRVSTPPASRINTPAPAPRINTPAPRVSTPAPRINTPPPAPRINTPPPAPRINTPPAPAPRINTPPPRVNTPAPRINTPPPRVNTPAPRINTPPPRVNTPPPRVNTPAPRINTPPPAPRVSSPPPAQRVTPSRPSGSPRPANNGKR
jgi:hypothetical protein